MKPMTYAFDLGDYNKQEIIEELAEMGIKKVRFSSTVCDVAVRIQSEWQRFQLLLWLHNEGYSVRSAFLNGEVTIIPF